MNARHQFYDGSTNVPIDRNDPLGRKHDTKLLCQTSNPEEKRRIIGDTFMKVCCTLLFNGFLSKIFLLNVCKWANEVCFLKKHISITIVKFMYEDACFLRVNHWRQWLPDVFTDRFYYSFEKIYSDYLYKDSML